MNWLMDHAHDSYVGWDNDNPSSVVWIPRTYQDIRPNFTDVVDSKRNILGAVVFLQYLERVKPCE